MWQDAGCIQEVPLDDECNNNSEQRWRKSVVWRIGADHMSFAVSVPLSLRVGISAEEAIVLAKVRWQIEQLFRLWRSEAQIDESVSAKPYRRLIKTARVVRSHAMSLAGALAREGAVWLVGVIQVLSRSLRGGACKMDKRKTHARISQLLLTPPPATLY